MRARIAASIPLPLDHCPFNNYCDVKCYLTALFSQKGSIYQKHVSDLRYLQIPGVVLS